MSAELIAIVGASAALVGYAIALILLPTYERAAFTASLVLAATAVAPTAFSTLGVWGIPLVYAGAPLALLLLKVPLFCSRLPERALLRSLDNWDAAALRGALFRHDETQKQIVLHVLKESSPDFRLRHFQQVLAELRWIDAMQPFLEDSDSRVRDFAFRAKRDREEQEQRDREIEEARNDPTGRNCSYCQGSNMSCPECGRGKSGGTYY